MPINITMPALSPTMEEGNLSKWLVKEGDKVKSGDVIAEIETDKATMEVEAVDEGTVAKLVVAAGTEGVKVNALIAVLAADGEDVSAAASSAGSAAPAPKADGAAAPKAEAAPAPAQSTPAAAPAPAAATASVSSDGSRTILFAACPQAGQGSRYRPFGGRRLRPARPRRQERHRSRRCRWRRQGRCCFRSASLRSSGSGRRAEGRLRRSRAQALRTGLLRARAA
ncbi:biotin/lipoyl-containing protein [Rhizobium beringeri]|uniref:biotin/lipoyl-containing protein n=1 Tax=Rhizobium beringeri TaxID=3019934 RepID=UPI00398EC421